MDYGLKIAIKTMRNVSNLAKKLELTKAAVGRWKVVPLARLEQVSAVTGLPIWTLHPVLRAAEKDIRADERHILIVAGYVPSDYVVPDAVDIDWNWPPRAVENKE